MPIKYKYRLNNELHTLSSFRIIFNEIIVLINYKEDFESTIQFRHLPLIKRS